MTSFEPLFASARAIAAAIDGRQISCREVVDACLWQIAAHDSTVHAICTLDGEGARRRARDADEALARGQSWGPLHGVPITIKDSLATEGLRTTLGMPELAQHIPDEDCTVVARLKKAGAIVLGKSNVPDGLRDWQTDNPLFGRTCNPWDMARTAGGSSGGAAAALTAGFTALDIGSDYGGSIRVPAGFCGVFGFKPSQGRVPETGQIISPGKTGNLGILNALGPMARDAEDLVTAFRLIAGPDGRDATVASFSVGAVPAAAIRGLRIAWMPTFPGVPVASAIAGALERFAAVLHAEGARVEVCFPTVDIEEQWQVREQLRDILVKGIGSRQSAVEPLQRRDHFIAAWEQFFTKWDLFLCPVAMTTAFPHCAPGTPQLVDGKEVEYHRLFLFSTIFNCTGHPAAVLPVGRDPSGLPIGIQAVGAKGQDEALLARVAALAKVVGPFAKPPGYGPS